MLPNIIFESPKFILVNGEIGLLVKCPLRSSDVNITCPHILETVLSIKFYENMSNVSRVVCGQTD